MSQVCVDPDPCLVAMARLEEALRDAFQAAWENNLSTGASRADVAGEILGFCDGVLGLILHERDAQLPELPEEIWGQIWLSLDLRERVAVSHVCRAWRSAATGMPSLWTDLRVQLVRHLSDCECNTCLDTDTIYDRPLTLEPMVQRLAVLLERSMDAPLTCVIHLPKLSTADSDSAASAKIWDMLAAHSAKLVSLTVHCPDIAWATSLMASLKHLPRLLELILGYKQAQGDRLTPAHLSAMPSLIRMNAMDVLTWDQQTASFPALRSLSISFFSVEGIARALRSCPNLTDLQAKLCFREFGSDAVHAELRSRCSKLDRLSLLRVPAAWKPQHFASLAHSDTRVIDVDYRSHAAMDLVEDLLGRGRDPANTAFTMSHLAGPISLSVTIPDHDNTVAITGRDSQYTRTLTGIDGTRTLGPSMPAVWRELATNFVVVLEVAWALRFQVLETHASLPALEHIIVTLPNYFRDGSQRSVTADGIAYATMPALSRLTMRSMRSTGSHPDVASLSASTAAHFVQTIASKRIDLLEIHWVRIIGNAQCMDSLAHSVTYSPDRGTMDAMAKRHQELLADW